uniref:Uncharacterized protein n=1 Tax=Meloidogyne floridensis TaxID=298350 RepID=A0A915P919_9BILA
MRQISSMASAVVVFALFQLLVYFGNVGAKSGTVGLGDHTLKDDGKVELHEQAKDKRCTVDLLTNQEEVFSFVAGLKGSTDELYKCLKAYNSSTVINNLPFMYRLTQAEFDKLETGKHKDQTKCGGDGDCADTRCKQSEIVWWRDENKVLANVSRAVGSLSASHSEIMINGEELTFTVTVKDQTECQNEPNNWEITGKNPKPEMKYLLVFHLLPQSSGRIIGQAEEDVDCNLELEITFNSSDYTLLMKGGEEAPIPTTPPPPSQPSTAKTDVKTTTKEVKNNITTTKAPEKKKGGSGGLILIVGVLLVLLGVKSEGGSQMSKNESVELADKGKKDAADPYAE